ncbi:hypothetical protein TNCT_693681 [Trichonephila clavata]|uniref:Uncharacterized protein n=1 Tax=Trichonephila clavata TaxID=2740835 RepID=A0A8X6HN35_TRICU|nr:hypothetical protein TNCT_693681 [Trichonephila clavata]
MSSKGEKSEDNGESEASGYLPRLIGKHVSCTVRRYRACKWYYICPVERVVKPRATQHSHIVGQSHCPDQYGPTALTDG